MASTSTSSIQKIFKYDVFLSFMGEDTLTTFVDPLYHALLEKGITTYKADEKFEKEGRIDDQLIRSIQDSRFHIVVFSKNYASSSCCLDELVEIIKCQKTAEQTAYPIFFDVEPTEVSNQSGPVGEAFAKLVAKHEKGSGMFSFFNLFTRKRKRTSEDVDLEKEDNVGRWRNALKEAASLAGLELKNTFNGYEAKYIQQIVEEVSRKLQFFNLTVDGKLVGMETTLARNICDHTSIRLEGESFVEDVREISKGSVGKRFKYDVFLSFRGEDTRKTFVDHLYLALVNKGIITYKDDEEIEKGERISEQLIRSIDESRFYIIVFSKNYASSSWCLDELVKIMECQKTIEHTAYPIFYDVEPTEVRRQSGSVGEAFAKHVEAESVGRWRDALKEAAGLAGWELKNTLDGHEAKFIEKIMEEILRKLYFINLSIDENLVGMEIRVNKIISSLEIGFEDVRMIGIKGIGGGGKTTLATAVFDHISIWFERISFIENVREVSKNSLSGLKELQKQLLSDVLNDQSIVIRSISDGKNKLKKEMGSRKVLVVLDDVDNVVQLEALAGKPSWFKPGSRIIIPTRDEQVLVSHRTNFIHDVNLLSHQEAICLFSRYAFEREIPIQGYKELAGKVVQYAAGLPLTIKLLGSFLCGKSKHEWIDAIRRLETIPLKETLEKLELSYNDLDNDHKEILLYVACILKGEVKDKTIRVLKSCGFHAEIGLKVLKQKSLLTISADGRLQLHDHIEEMGMNIIRRLHPEEPNKHNLLWIEEEIEDILVNDLGTEATSGIKLGYTLLHPTIIMKGLKKMKELRFLYMTPRYNSWKFDEAGEYLPNTLQCLHWPGYPFSCLPKTFQANKLVNLEMDGSNISQLFEGGERKVLKNLKFLDLQSSKLRTFDLGLTPNLETLSLQRCSHFVELYIPVSCPMLKSINLSGTKLSNLNLGLIPHLEMLDLRGCNHFAELHMPVEHLLLNCTNLYLCGSKVTNLNLVMTPNIKIVDLRGCNHFVEFHMPVEHPMLNCTHLYLCGEITNHIHPQVQGLLCI